MSHLSRTHADRALLDAIKDDVSMAAHLLRKGYHAVVELNSGPSPERPESPGRPDTPVDEVIGDDACRVLVQELDWAEPSAGGGQHD